MLMYSRQKPSSHIVGRIYSPNTRTWLRPCSPPSSCCQFLYCPRNMSWLNPVPNSANPVATHAFDLNQHPYQHSHCSSVTTESPSFASEDHNLPPAGLRHREKLTRERESEERLQRIQGTSLDPEIQAGRDQSFNGLLP